VSTQSVRALSASADSTFLSALPWISRFRRPRRIAGTVLAGVALPLALLGMATAPAGAQAQPAPGSGTAASLISAEASGSRSPAVTTQTPRGYFLGSGLHLQLRTDLSPSPHLPVAQVAAGAGRAPVTAVAHPAGAAARPRTTAAVPRPVPAAQPVQVVKAVPVPARTSGGRSLGIFVITCSDLQGSTATGADTSMSTVAVDPSVIPLGTTIYIQGVGSRVAQDTGGAIVGNRLDLWEPSYDACVDWGVQSRQVSIEG
jgi:3D (Asp-Asp-Asp) domain-containing protein